MMADDPQTVLEFAERVAREGGWGEANVLAKRYLKLHASLRDALACIERLALSEGHAWGALAFLKEQRKEHKL